MRGKRSETEDKVFCVHVCMCMYVCVHGVSAGDLCWNYSITLLAM